MNKIIILGDHKDVCNRLKEQFIAMGYFAEQQILNSSRLDAYVYKKIETLKEKSIVLAYKNEELKNASEIFYRHGITDLYIFPRDTHIGNAPDELIKDIIQIDNKKPRLDYLEIEVSEGCNLNCKGCNEFSNLVDENKFGDLDSVRSDLMRLRELFWGIEKIRLMGGEPLVNPDFPKFVQTARDIFPDSDLRLLSNGLLIPNLRSENLEEIKKHNCSFDISVYPPTKQIIHKITDRLEEYGIPFSLSLPNMYFFKSLLAEPLSSPDESFKNCLFTHCHAVSGGYLSACSNQMYAHRLNTAFDLKFPENDKINIHTTTLNGWEINKTFTKPHEFCKYCGKGLVPFKWKTCAGNKAKASDWLIEPTFTNTKVLPFVQKIAKTPAKHLRTIIRSPKSRPNK